MRRALIALGIGLSVLTSTAPAQAVSVVNVRLAYTTAAAQEVARFWLADGAANLRNATPYDVQTELAGERLATDVAPTGPAYTIPPVESVAQPAGDAPATLGKVFFIGSDLKPHWCTGTSVQTQYRNLVATAGHCVLDVEAPMGALGKWVFVPGYAEGEIPHGLYVGKEGIGHYDFDDLRDRDRDYGFAVVHDGVALSGADALTSVGRLGDNVGGQGLTFNQPLVPAADLFGYPGGESLGRAAGSPFAMLLAGPREDRPVGVDSSYDGEGWLGSPWLTRYAADTRTGYLNGVTMGVSDTDGDGAYDASVSAYFDGAAGEVYRYAAHRWSGRIT
ncbi:hypothetical protein FXF51_45300 [Nonomuraea sp. PA05]|uniref:hypothetical protein n=1 Tax=Nonomuraea sp. PA05 TaxID=2604466 RepID=UPI0011D37752|nr:hypothetical protein [Nonomuraea sp. PA05]TYB56035.1 hypothetical protein FXF51_45300 [Nonomuraea sp. PA05]